MFLRKFVNVWPKKLIGGGSEAASNSNSESSWKERRCRSQASRLFSRCLETPGDGSCSEQYQNEYLKCMGYRPGSGSPGGGSD